MSSSDSPMLSAVVVVGEQRERAERSLRHLLAQTVLERMEIVVVDLSRDPIAFEGLDQPRVRWFHRPNLETFGAARAECAWQSRGSIIAYLEDHCYADPRWAEEVIGAFERPVDLVNYCVTNANPERLLCRAFLMAEYGRWLDPAISGYVPISVCNNVAYRRTALEPYWDRIDRLCEAEFVLHREMQAGGARVWLAAEAKLAHENWTRLREGLEANGYMKRLLAAERAAQGDWGTLTRLGWAGAMAITPPLHIARLARSLVRRPRLWPLFWASFPLMNLLYVSSAWAEAKGYLFGPGDCSERFRDLEVSIARQA